MRKKITFQSNARIESELNCALQSANEQFFCFISLYFFHSLQSSTLNLENGLNLLLHNNAYNFCCCSSSFFEKLNNIFFPSLFLNSNCIYTILNRTESNNLTAPKFYFRKISWASLIYLCMCNRANSLDSIDIRGRL